MGDGAMMGERLTYDAAFQLYQTVLRPRDRQIVQDVIDDAVDELVFFHPDPLRTDCVRPPTGRAFTPKPAEIAPKAWCGGAKSASPYSSLFTPPHPLSPRGASVFKKLGRFCIT